MNSHVIPRPERRLQMSLMCKSLVTLSFLTATIRSAPLQGSFSVLSYNVAGLPEFLSSGNPVVNTPLISTRLKPYNVIHVQEDFNFHEVLYAGDSHAFRTVTSGIAGIGSGLNSLSDFPFLDFERIKWDVCSPNQSDCLTPKGFTWMRVRIADGAWVDFYNLHGDAGDEPGDIMARESNDAQLSNYIQTWSAGMPVIVMGDTNGRYSRPGDAEALRDLLSAGNFTDSWAINTRGGSLPASGSPALVCPFPFAPGTIQAEMVLCEVVDKILVRSSPAIAIRPTAFTNENDAFVNATGAPLSDHYPIGSVIAWSLSHTVRLADPIGGQHGNPFNDIPTVMPLSNSIPPKITSITIRSGNRVNGVSFTTSAGTVIHGGTGGSPATLTMNPGEFVDQLQTCRGRILLGLGPTRVFFLKMVTNQGRSLQGGKATSDCVTTNIPSDAGSSDKQWGLVAFWGRQADEIIRLGAIWGAVY